ncbi:hypothetical protein TSUD_288860, partial [Trifolium subterraneum]
MATAIAKQNDGGGGLTELYNDDAVLEIATIALCVVLTNAVEVHDNEGCAVGIAVFEHAFSWINHSCSPNACYRFSFSNSSTVLSVESKLCITPFTRNSEKLKIDCGIFGPKWLERVPLTVEQYNNDGKTGGANNSKNGENNSAKSARRAALRQSELWSKYRFICCCKRCSSQPFTYVDHVLQEIPVFCGDSSGLPSNYKFFRDTADRRLADSIEDAISEYLLVGDSVTCCENLEKILIEGLYEKLEGNETKSQFKFMLHPLHHLSLSSYTTLASAYKVRASDSLSVDSETVVNQSEAFHMSRISAAYSLFLADAAHYLFNSESSLIASVANFWIGAGESLLTFTRNSGW